MKTFRNIITVLALLVAFSINAQQSEEMKTLFTKSGSDTKISHGGYGSFSIGYS